MLWRLLTPRLSTINLGKYGSFPANSIIGRPYYLTFEILDKNQEGGVVGSGLRLIRAEELYIDIEDEQTSTPADEETRGTIREAGGVEYDVVGQDGEVVMRTNRRIVDDPKTQIMSMDEIEAMKSEGMSGRDLVAKILESHSALDQKTAFALAKYTLRKRKKYLKRFTVLPLDVLTLAQWIFRDKEASKIMDLRTEILALIGSWSNIHYTPPRPAVFETPSLNETGGGKWLVVDETAGLLTAYLAEKMGILSPSLQESVELNETQSSQKLRQDVLDEDLIEESKDMQKIAQPPKPALPAAKDSSNSSMNTIHVIHAASQPNLSLLKYFDFDPFNPMPSHPLTKHLKTLSWLQLLAPSEDAGYTEPEPLSHDDLQAMKSGKRSNYFRKRRRWKRIKAIVDETRAGAFDGLIVASVMKPVTILRHLIPLLKGGGQVVVYTPTIEPLTALADLYSTGRRTAFLSDPSNAEAVPTEDFPVNPTLLLAPTVQTARARSWQVLPERTHPLMTGRGGSDGFVFTSTRVLPADGKVEARGKNKRRKLSTEVEGLKDGSETLNAVAENVKNEIAQEVFY